LVFIILSYVQNVRAVLRIASEQGWHKTFSTCLPHLCVVSLFISIGMFAYLRPSLYLLPLPKSHGDELFSMVPPAVNPLIYTEAHAAQG
ncbi:OL145 protein, partial [Picathartes gymnocephalus]|nr:OL145 protein [Picathartes gymnocephalus]